MYYDETMNTDIRKNALGVLENAEQSLRKLISQAALEQQYDEVAWILELAKQVWLVRERNAVESSQDLLPANGSEADNKNTSRIPIKHTKHLVETKKNGTYPRFSAQEDRLIKTGWSKKNKAEYEHRAPRGTIEKIFDAISQVGNNGSFDIEAISPLVEQGDDLVPIYQIYMAIGWLRDNGFLVKCGRNEYGVSDATNHVDFKSLWKKLPRY